MKLNPININYQSLKQYSNPSFGKTRLGHDTINTRNGKGADVYFVEYNLDDAADYQQIKSLKSLWGRGSYYIDRIIKLFKNLREKGTSQGNHFYGLEDEYSNTLAIANVVDSDTNNNKIEENCVKIAFIQTDPDEMHNSVHRRYFGLGEILVSKIVQKARDEYADSVELTSANEGFWAQNGFFKKVSAKSGAFPIRRLENCDFDNYIDYVEFKKHHTGYSA